MKNTLFVYVLWTIVVTAGSHRCVRDEFSERVEVLASRVRMSAERLQMVPSVLRDLERVLSTRWPGAQVIRFGSTATGLALTQSDVDAFVRLPNTTATSEGTIVQDAVKVLELHPDIFSGFVTRVNMTVPFLTFQHIPTGFFIDVLFNFEVPVKNTDLIRYLVNTDKCVLNLTIVIKHWAKVHNITKNKVFPTSAIIFLVVFYLQQVGKLPPVVMLQSNAEPHLADGWNLGFDEIVDYKPRNESSLYDLLGGFFLYYGNFDFDENIISLYLGRPVKRDLFRDLQSVPTEYELYRQNVGTHLKSPLMCPRVCIQEPFVHNKHYGETHRFDSSPSSTFMMQMRRAELLYKENNKGEFLNKILTTNDK